MAVTPYLFLDGRCEEAIDFYKKNLGAEVGMIMRFKDAPPQDGHTPPPGSENRVMHACVTINGAPLMMSDGCADKKPEFKGFALSLDAKNAADCERMFKSLTEGGTVQQPLVETFFAERFGMVADKFGVGWMIVAGARNP
jgi:PhnB protein